MDRIDLALPILALVLLVGAALVALARRRVRSWRARSRARRAIRGERRAEILLEARGYAIEARQHAGQLVLEVDGARHAAPLRCDLVVTRGGARYVAEVKTGAVAPRLDHAPTRRQLLEYLLAFDADGVLLVDAERDEIREVRLRRAERTRPTTAWPWIAITALAIAAWLAAR